MLDENVINKMVERLVNRIEKGNEYILRQIGESILQIGTLNPTRARQLAQILKYGGNFEKISQKLAEITNKNVQDIYRIFEEVAKDNYMFAKQFYDYRGINYIPFEENYALKSQIKALATITASEYINFSRTSALGFGIPDAFGRMKFKGLQETYQEVIDEAVILVSQGKDTFNNQMKKIIKDIGESGVKVVYPTTYLNKDGELIHTTRRLDSAVRMNLKSAIRDLQSEMSKQFGEEYGANGVEISVHLNPAPDHSPIQGHQFNINNYLNMQSSLPFKDVKGRKYDPIERHIREWNCYHTEFNIIIGISKPEYTDEELEEILKKNEEGFEFEGKHYTNYEGTQLQRKIETAIRQQKEVLEIAKASMQNSLILETKAKINSLLYKYKELSKVSGLSTRMERI